MTHPCLEYLRQLAGAAPRDLRTLQLRLTAMGVQRKPLPTVHLTTYHHLPRGEWFATPSEPAFGLFATIAPDDFPPLLAALAAAIDPAAGADEPPLLAIAVALRESRLGDGACELMLGARGAAAATGAMLARLRPGEPAHVIVALQRTSLLGEGA